MIGATAMKRLMLIFLLFSIATPALTQMERPGEGTFKDPFVLNYLADSGALISLRVTGLERPARPEASPTPPAGEEYVLVSVDIECAAPRAENCFLSSLDFTMSGERGILYETPLATGATDEIVEIELEPGGAASVDWLFLVNAEDANLVLHYYNHMSMPFAFPLVFATEAIAAALQPIAVRPTIGYVTRVGPSAELAFAGIVHHNESLVARGRNADGSWLEIAGIGWLPTEFAETEGDVMSLPIAR